MRYAKIAHGVFLCFIMCFFASCSSDSKEAKSKECIDIIPKKLPGLEVTGVRPKANVIHNLVPFNCAVQSQYAERLQANPGLSGRVKISFSVEFQGEVTNNRIVESTIEDSVFMKQFEHTMRWLEFDPWGDVEDETDVVYTMQFKQ